MSDNSVLAFRERFRTRELLAIDELHRLPGDDYLLQEMRATIDTLEERGAIIVVTSTQPVTALPNLSPDLRSRFASGLMLQLAAPGVAARMRIVQHVSSALGRPLPDEAIHRLASGLHGTASRLIGAIFELSRNCKTPPINRIACLRRMMIAGPHCPKSSRSWRDITACSRSCLKATRGSSVWYGPGLPLSTLLAS